MGAARASAGVTSLIGTGAVELNKASTAGSNYRRSMIVTFAIAPAPAPPERSPSNYRRSMIVTFAWPPPSHMVCRP